VEIETGRLAAAAIDLGSTTRVASITLGRGRWTREGAAVAYTGIDGRGRTGIFEQDFDPERDTASTRRPMAGFDDELQTESFGVAPDGSRVVLAVIRETHSLMLADGLPDVPQSGGTEMLGGSKALATATVLCLGAVVVGGVDGGPSQGVTACQRVESERFVLYSDPWLNLHHFLFQWARAATPPAPGDRRRAVEVPERDRAGELSQAEGEAWDRAVAFYAEHFVPKDLLFTRELVELKALLAGVSCSDTGLEDLDGELRAVLSDAWPVYRERWWPEHDRANRAWIETQVALLGTYEEALARRLAEAYGGEWPAERVRVDVTVYANWAGAYTTNRPVHVTISSRDYEGLQGLELLFHEVSHANFFEQPLLGQLAAAFRRQGTELPERLSHVIQFVTPAEILRSLMKNEGREDVELVADAMAQRRRSREQYRIVREHWGAFLAGDVARGEALDQIAAELAC
jgi:hypothetical protein